MQFSHSNKHKSQCVLISIFPFSLTGKKRDAEYSNIKITAVFSVRDVKHFIFWKIIMSENAKQNGGDAEVKPSTSLQCTCKEVITVKGEVKICYIFIKNIKIYIKISY